MIDAMKVLARYGREELAYVYIAETDAGKTIEFVESVQPPVPREEKWVLIVSTLFGCPVGCAICDAGRWFDGQLSRRAILAQIDYLVTSRYPDRRIPAGKFKIQFARMGDPAFNPTVIEILRELPHRYDAPGLLPCLSSVAPRGTDRFFSGLDLRNEGVLRRCQMQFSIHSTDEQVRDRLIPVKKWSFQRIAEFGRRFFIPGDRKIALNFALAEKIPIDPGVLLEFFDPDRFLIKLTPVNPTLSATENGVINALTGESCAGHSGDLVRRLKRDYEVIVSIGELEENRIGSNCGQYARLYHKKHRHHGAVKITVPNIVAGENF
jgi:23S rRNA (adenine2503-C2)-methyltransferase